MIRFIEPLHQTGATLSLFLAPSVPFARTRSRVLACLADTLHRIAWSKHGELEVGARSRSCATFRGIVSDEAVDVEGSVLAVAGLPIPTDYEPCLWAEVSEAAVPSVIFTPARGDLHGYVARGPPMNPSRKTLNGTKPFVWSPVIARRLCRFPRFAPCLRIPVRLAKRHTEPERLTSLVRASCSSRISSVQGKPRAKQRNLQDSTGQFVAARL